MDKMLYIAMSGAHQTMLAQRANNNNLANANTYGFREDLSAFRSMPVFGEGHASRVYAMTERPSFDHAIGMIRSTGRDLDISVENNGWISVQARNGDEAYTKAGNLSIGPGGLLVTGAGHPVLGEGGPIALPPSERVIVGTDGTVTVQPIGQPANALVVVDRIKLVNPEKSVLVKGSDGLVRLKGGAEAEADASVKVVSGSLETSNVNIVDSLVNMIELSRRYESQVKLMRTAEENDEKTDALLKLS
ncbi:MAG: flagellar basal body rod protein FlgF [Gammaproteobacteria bacterium]|nr:flagellar basal body rod protein FlgF [Gammaproteobacteria bacterium]